MILRINKKLEVVERTTNYKYISNCKNFDNKKNTKLIGYR